MHPTTYPETFVWLCAIAGSAFGLIAGYVLGYANAHNRAVNRRRRFWQSLSSTTKTKNQCN